jgi:hypothetical protein
MFRKAARWCTRQQLYFLQGLCEGEVNSATNQVGLRCVLARWESADHAEAQTVWPLGSRGWHRENLRARFPHRGIHVNENYPSDLGIVNMKILFWSKFVRTLPQGKGRGECQRQWT